MNYTPEVVAATARLNEMEAASQEWQARNMAGEVSDSERESRMDAFSAEYDEKRNLEKLVRMTAPLFEVGDGITELGYSDRHAYTVVAVSKNGKRITIQQDKAIRDPNWKPEVIPGGFAGHCTNQNSQSYTYERNPNGSTMEVSLRTKKLDPKYNNGISVRTMWVRVGMSTASANGKTQFIEGRSEFYDYNF